MKEKNAKLTTQQNENKVKLKTITNENNSLKKRVSILQKENKILKEKEEQTSQNNEKIQNVVKSNHIRLTAVIKEQQKKLANHEKKLRESIQEISRLNEILIQKEKELQNTLTKNENEIQKQKELFDQSEIQKNELHSKLKDTEIQSEIQKNALHSKLKDSEIKQAYVLRLEKQIKTKNDELALKEKQMKKWTEKKKLKESSTQTESSPRESNKPGVYMDEIENVVVIAGKKYPYPIFDKCYKELINLSIKNNNKLPKNVPTQLDCFKSIYTYMEAARLMNYNFEDQWENERKNYLDQNHILSQNREQNRLQDMANKSTPKKQISDVFDGEQEFPKPKKPSFHKKIKVPPEERNVMNKFHSQVHTDAKLGEKTAREENSENKLLNLSTNENDNQFEKNFEQVHFELDETKDILELFKKTNTEIQNAKDENKFEKKFQNLQNISTRFDKKLDQVQEEIDEITYILEPIKKTNTQIKNPVLEKNSETKLEIPVDFSYLKMNPKNPVLKKNSETKMEMPGNFSYLEMNTDLENASNVHKIMSDDSFASLFVEAELNSMGVHIDKKCKSAKKNKKKNKKTQQESFEELLEKQMAAMSENVNPVLNSCLTDQHQKNTAKQKRKQKDKEKNNKACDISDNSTEKLRDENLFKNDVTMAPLKKSMESLFTYQHYVNLMQNSNENIREICRNYQ